MGTLSFFSAVLTASDLPPFSSTFLELEAELTAEALFLETAEDLFSPSASFLVVAEALAEMAFSTQFIFKIFYLRLCMKIPLKSLTFVDYECFFETLNDSFLPLENS